MIRRLVIIIASSLCATVASAAISNLENNSFIQVTAANNGIDVSGTAPGYEGHSAHIYLKEEFGGDYVTCASEDVTIDETTAAFSRDDITRDAGSWAEFELGQCTLVIQGESGPLFTNAFTISPDL